MEIDCQNLNVNEFSKICRLCLVIKELKPLTGEETNTLVKLTPRIIELETNVFFPNKICSDCAIQLQQVNEFLQRCTMLTDCFHECIEKYRESGKKDSRLPSLEVIFFTTEVEIKQKVEESDHEYKKEVCTSVPFTKVLVRQGIKREFEGINFIPQQTTSNQSIDLPDITAPKSVNKLNNSNLENNPDNDTPVFTKHKCLVRDCNGLQQGAKKHYLPASKINREKWLKNIDRLEIINVPFTRSKNWGICSKHFLSSAYKHIKAKILIKGAEPISPFSPFPAIEKAVPKIVVEEVHVECKKTSAELCTDDVLKKTIKTYERRRLQEITADEDTTYYIDLTT